MCGEEVLGWGCVGRRSLEGCVWGGGPWKGVCGGTVLGRGVWEGGP